jgi:hypothetical protein
VTTTQTDLAEILESALTQILEEMYFCTPESRGKTSLEGLLRGAELPFLSATGPVPRDGLFRLIVTDRLAVQLAAEFLPAAPEDVSPEQAEEMVAELTNVACGAVLSAWMPGVEFRLNLPRILSSIANSEPFEHSFHVACGPGSPERAELAVEIRF